jgi:hypothetical protein
VVVEPSQLDRDERGAAGPSHLRLGEILIRNGLIAQDDLALALSQQDVEDHDLPLGRLLVELGAITDATLTRALAEQSGLPVVDLDLLTPDPDVVTGLSEETATSLLALPLERRHDMTIVAVGEPPTRDFRREIVRVLHTRVDFVLAVPSALRAAIERVYAVRTPTPAEPSRDEPTVFEALGLEEVDDTGDTAPALIPLERAARTSDTAIAWLLTLAREHGANALQLHAEPNAVRVRGRIDTETRDLIELPEPAATLLVRRVFVAFGLPADTTRVDGATCHHGVPGFGPALSLTAAPTTDGSVLLIRPVGLPTAGEPSPLGLDVAVSELEPLLAASRPGLVVLVSPDPATRRTALRELALDPIMETRSVGTVGIRADVPMPRVSRLDPATIGGFVPTLRLSLDLGNDVVLADVDDDTGPQALEAVVDAAFEEPVLVIAGIGAPSASAAITDLSAAAGAPLVASTLALVIHVDPTAGTAVLRVSDEFREAVFDGRRPDDLLGLRART